VEDGFLILGHGNGVREGTHLTADKTLPAVVGEAEFLIQLRCAEFDLRFVDILECAGGACLGASHRVFASSSKVLARSDEGVDHGRVHGGCALFESGEHDGLGGARLKADAAADAHEVKIRFFNGARRPYKVCSGRRRNNRDKS